jgi:hypothetical protein
VENDLPSLHNSRVLTLFDEVLHSPRSGLRVVEIAGRGIVAEAGCILATLVDKTRKYDDSAQIQRVLADSDRLMRLGEIEDDLVELWRVRSAGELSDQLFEQELNSIVNRLEAWRDDWAAGPSAG